MKPSYVVYECENCGKLFYREVEEVLTDDAENCAVNVKLIAEKDTNDIEEFPMCECVGGDGGYIIGSVKDPAPTVA
jgi:hypothetical protein